MKNGDMPANPMTNEQARDSFLMMHNETPDGVTKREYFAGLAMQGIAGRPGSTLYSDAAFEAVKFADALLNQLQATERDYD